MSNQDNGAQSIPSDSPNTQDSAPAEPRKATGKGTGVAASPLNGVKLDLAIILLLAIVLLLSSFVLNWPGSWGLAGYSMLSAFWLVWRTRKVLLANGSEQD